MDLNLSHKRLKYTKAYRDAIERLKSMKRLFLVFCVMFAVLITLAGTLAWFIADDSFVNHVKAAMPKFFGATLVDKFTPPADPPGEDDTFPKRVGAVNTEELPALVRLIALPVVIAADGKTLLPATIGGPGSGATVIMDDFTKLLNI